MINIDNQEQDKLSIINEQIKVIYNKQSILNNELYHLNKKQIELSQEKCRGNIGRCFKKIQNSEVLSYCKVINIDKLMQTIHNTTFNEYQYPSLWFKYPYTGSKTPFYKENMFSGVWGSGHNHIDKIRSVVYVEITNKEFMEKFNEVNELWVDVINDLIK